MMIRYTRELIIFMVIHAGKAGQDTIRGPNQYPTWPCFPNPLARSKPTDGVAVGQGRAAGRGDRQSRLGDGPRPDWGCRGCDRASGLGGQEEQRPPDSYSFHAARRLGRVENLGQWP